MDEATKIGAGLVFALPKTAYVEWLNSLIIFIVPSSYFFKSSRDTSYFEFEFYIFIINCKLVLVHFAKPPNLNGWFWHL
jgi:hypothetical protein